MFKSIFGVEEGDLDEKLNGIEEGWEVFNVMPNLRFERVKMGFGISVSLPCEITYTIVFKKET